MSDWLDRFAEHVVTLGGALSIAVLVVVGWVAGVYTLIRLGPLVTGSRHPWLWCGLIILVLFLFLCGVLALVDQGGN